MSTTNGELVLRALTELFVNRDTSAIEGYWTESYRQHNPEIPHGGGGWEEARFLL